MNKHKFFAAGLAVAMLATACKKTDVEAPVTETPAATTAVATQGSWKAYSNWTAQPQENNTTYTTTLADKNITADVAANGLVLVFKKGSDATVALPVEEKGAQSYFWYYQVSEGSLQITADAAGTAKAPGADQNFSYFILSAEKIAALSDKGYSKAELMKLTYETAAALLK